MRLNNIIKQTNFFPTKKEILEIKRAIDKFVPLIEKEISNRQLDAEIFIGGSFAKGTLTKEKNYEIDIFVRFNLKYENISEHLEKIVYGVLKKTNLKFIKFHGSRDYFKIYYNEKIMFEVIPVIKINNVKQAKNVTDLSYFHVNYVKRRANKKLKEQIIIAKKFFKALRVYGAESYICGFSGYAIECLIIYYKSFEKMLKDLVKIKLGERKVIDPAKHFKKKERVFLELNESKLHSPIILIDPTWKERNVLAALSQNTFEKFRCAAQEFLKKPSSDFFILKEINPLILQKEAKKSKSQFLKIKIETDRQEGDIAGTKMKKFALFLEKELTKYYKINKFEFDYGGFDKKAFAYYIVKPKKEIIKKGPSVEDVKNAKKFKKKNKNVFEKNGFLHARIEINLSADEFLKNFVKKEKNKKIKEMGITKIEILNNHIVK